MEVTEWEKELEAMPGEEKAKAMRDLYGKAKPINETPELVSSALEELAGHLSEEQHDKEAFLDAQERIPELVDSVDFRLMFLRATQFNAKVRTVYWKQYGFKKCCAMIKLLNCVTTSFTTGGRKSNGEILEVQGQLVWRRCCFSPRRQSAADRFE
jgi:hypothetical protein